MPIYEYRCKKCGHSFELLQKISTPAPETCPECGAAAISRLISPVAFRLKGSGWYETDFKTKNRHNLVDSPENKNADKTAESKTADASAAKPAAESTKTPAPAKPKDKGGADKKSASG